MGVGAEYGSNLTVMQTKKICRSNKWWSPNLVVHHVVFVNTLGDHSKTNERPSAQIREPGSSGPSGPYFAAPGPPPPLRFFACVLYGSAAELIPSTGPVGDIGDDAPVRASGVYPPGLSESWNRWPACV